MLKIHKSHFKKLLLISITSICITFGLLGLYYLTYIPELSHAETVTYDPIPRYHPNISDITYMQDMTEEVCQNSYENDTKQLIDKRDNKTYWVTKLKDGNCWMTQNLDLDLYTNGANRKLTTVDSDVQSDWTSVTGPSNPWAGSLSTANMVRYYDPGEYIYTTPTIQNNCTSTSGIAGCTSKGWQQVAGLSKDISSNRQAHYSVGNYYSWAAATANSGTNIINGDNASSSICPKGWQLPTASSNAKSKSFAHLFESYGWTWNKGQYTDTLNGGTVYNILNSPFYFLYGGSVAGDGSLWSVGSDGRYWSSTTYDSDRAYHLFFSDIAGPFGGGGRYSGFSVRCVARGEAVVRPEAPSIDSVTININPRVSLDVADEVVVEKSETNPSTADLKVKVSSNQPYSVNINAKDHAELVSENGDKILSNGGALTTAENNWGIMKPGDTIYTKITTSPELFYQATSAEAKDILFKIGISTAPDLANGTYATDIVITATQN